MRIDRTNSRTYAIGATVLGTGGGGDPHIGRLLLDQTVGESGWVDIVSADSLPEDALIVTIGCMGAPTVVLEKLMGIAEGERAIDAIEQRLSNRVSAIMSVEIGGMNAVYPLAIAAKRQLPVINGDGMGRAFPELQMVSFNIHGCSGSPIALTSEVHDLVMLEGDDNERLERLARPVAVAMGGQCTIACYPMTAKMVQRTAILGTLSVALDIGKAIEHARRAGENPVMALVNCMAGTSLYRNTILLGSGRVVDIDRQIVSGYTIGKVMIESLSDRSAKVVTFRNEYLKLEDGLGLIAIAPDLITLVDSVTGEPITTDAVKYGQRVSIIGAESPAIFRSSRGLQVCGPRAFGFDDPFDAIEDIAARRDRL
jgi:DUF917 family protein